MIDPDMRSMSLSGSAYLLRRVGMRIENACGMHSTGATCPFQKRDGSICYPRACAHSAQYGWVRECVAFSPPYGYERVKLNSHKWVTTSGNTLGGMFGAGSIEIFFFFLHHKRGPLKYVYIPI